MNFSVGKKIISLFLVVSAVVMVFTTTMAYAEIDTNMVLNDVKVVSISETDGAQEVVISEKGKLHRIALEENQDTVETTITNLETNESDCFIVDKNNGTLYSSITGKTFDISEELNYIEEKTDVATFAASKDETVAFNFSFKTLEAALDADAKIATIAGLILTMVSAALAYPLLTTVALLVDTFGYALDLVSKALKKNLKIAGIKGYSTKVTYTKHQAGQVFHTDKYKISRLETYK